MVGFESAERLWHWWNVWKRTGLAPSEALDIDYRWVALDLDNAVAEFGEFVEGEIRDEVERAADGLDPKMERPDRRVRLRAKAEEVWWRLVKREVRLKRSTAAATVNGVYYPPRTYWFVKEYTGDPMVDNDMSEAKIVWCND